MINSPTNSKHSQNASRTYYLGSTKKSNFFNRCFKVDERFKEIQSKTEKETLEEIEKEVMSPVPQYEIKDWRRKKLFISNDVDKENEKYHSLVQYKRSMDVQVSEALCETKLQLQQLQTTIMHSIDKNITMQKLKSLPMLSLNMTGRFKTTESQDMESNKIKNKKYMVKTNFLSRKTIKVIEDKQFKELKSYFLSPNFKEDSDQTIFKSEVSINHAKSKTKNQKLQFEKLKDSDFFLSSNKLKRKESIFKCDTKPKQQDKQIQSTSLNKLSPRLAKLTDDSQKNLEAQLGILSILSEKSYDIRKITLTNAFAPQLKKFSQQEKAERFNRRLKKFEDE